MITKLALVLHNTASARKHTAIIVLVADFGRGRHFVRATRHTVVTRRKQRRTQSRFRHTVAIAAFVAPLAAFVGVGAARCAVEWWTELRRRCAGRQKDARAIVGTRVVARAALARRQVTHQT